MISQVSKHEVCMVDLTGVQMIKNKRRRRTGALTLVILGGVMMFLAAEVWQGAVLFILGVVLELVGITLEQQDK